MSIVGAHRLLLLYDPNKSLPSNNHIATVRKKKCVTKILSYMKFIYKIG